MNENPTTAPTVDTTDSLEAVSAFKSFKNLMFLISFVCLILLQAAFWMNYLDLIDKADCSCPEPQPVSTEVAADPSLAQQATAEAMLATAGTPAEASKSCKSASPAGIFDINTIISSLGNPTCRQATCVIATCNCILFIAVLLFSLSLLVSLKISIVGRLGGINDIARAFLLSLFMVVLIVPWQICLPQTVVGAIYTPEELLCTDVITCQGPLADCIFYFGRFTGLWAVVTLLLIAAQIRSLRWSKAIVRRLRILN